MTAPGNAGPKKAVPQQVLQARERAELMVDADAVQFAIDQTAVRLSTLLAEENPLVLCVLQGGLAYTGELSRRLHFPLQLSYVHVSRYRGATHGATLEWIARPPLDVAGRHVLLVDDILDQGVTLSELVRWTTEQGARKVTTTVLVDKQIAQPTDRPGDMAPGPADRIAVDYPALACPDRYLFGCGMDFQGYWRNLPAIYALPRDMEDAH
jgi:hypoxanthine phosphoribosyltransferase